MPQPWWDFDLAPDSWLVERDVEEGLRRLNFSEWDRSQRDVRRKGIDRLITCGFRPPWYYLQLHLDKRLTASEQDELRQGRSRRGLLLRATAEILSKP
jgi:hypothetical protein